VDGLGPVDLKDDGKVTLGDELAATYSPVLGTIGKAVSGIPDVLSNIMQIGDKGRVERERAAEQERLKQATTLAAERETKARAALLALPQRGLTPVTYNARTDMVNGAGPVRTPAPVIQARNTVGTPTFNAAIGFNGLSGQPAPTIQYQPPQPPKDTSFFGKIKSLFGF
jgi:hypothetical protein